MSKEAVLRVNPPSPDTTAGDQEQTCQTSAYKILQSELWAEKSLCFKSLRFRVVFKRAKKNQQDIKQAYLKIYNKFLQISKKKTDKPKFKMWRQFKQALL